ncbi:glycosyltransferase [bacterium]|nr:glycosyltransferase [bacterium]
MKILLLNDTYFASAFRKLGHEVLTVGPGFNSDVRFDPASATIPDLVSRLDFSPDLAMQIDSIDSRVFFQDIHQLKIPTAYYAIDAPINEFWQQHYIHAFDRVYIDQHQQWRKWSRNGVDWLRWLPLAADSDLYHPPLENADRDIQLLFVGTINGQLRPKRSAIIYRLKQIVDVKVVDGGGNRSTSPQEVADLYRRSNIVLNELLFDGINLRTMEAMACGTVVLTERQRGEDRLFEDLTHLVTYEQNDLEKTVRSLLLAPDRIKEIGNTGSELIRKNHVISVRAKQVLKDLANLSVRPARFDDASIANVLWGQWHASWKWHEQLNWIRTTSEKQLVERLSNLDPQKKATLHFALGNFQESFNELAAIIRANPEDLKSRASAASIALAAGQLQQAVKIIGNGTPETRVGVHIAIGDLLRTCGHDLVPGYNQVNAPITTWSAFEHYLNAYQLDESNRSALERIEAVLSDNKAIEFVVPMWQRFHANNPTDIESMVRLRETANLGYYMPSNDPPSSRRDLNRSSQSRSMRYTLSSGV